MLRASSCQPDRSQSEEEEEEAEKKEEETEEVGTVLEAERHLSVQA